MKATKSSMNPAAPAATAQSHGIHGRSRNRRRSDIHATAPMNTATTAMAGSWDMLEHMSSVANASATNAAMPKLTTTPHRAT